MNEKTLFCSFLRISGNEILVHDFGWPLWKNDCFVPFLTEPFEIIFENNFCISLVRKIKYKIILIKKTQMNERTLILL